MDQQIFFQNMNKTAPAASGRIPDPPSGQVPAPGHNSARKPLPPISRGGCQKQEMILCNPSAQQDPAVLLHGSGQSVQDPFPFFVAITTVVSLEAMQIQEYDRYQPFFTGAPVKRGAPRMWETPLFSFLYSFDSGKHLCTPD